MPSTSFGNSLVEDSQSMDSGDILSCLFLEIQNEDLATGSLQCQTQVLPSPTSTSRRPPPPPMPPIICPAPQREPTIPLDGPAAQTDVAHQRGEVEAAAALRARTPSETDASMQRAASLPAQTRQVEPPAQESETQSGSLALRSRSLEGGGGRHVGSPTETRLVNTDAELDTEPDIQLECMKAGADCAAGLPSMQDVYQSLRRDAVRLATTRATCTAAGLPAPAAAPPSILLEASQPTTALDPVKAERLRRLGSEDGSGLWARALLRANLTNTPPSGCRDITEADLQPLAPASGCRSGAAAAASHAPAPSASPLQAAPAQPRPSSSRGLKRTRAPPPAQVSSSAPESVQVMFLKKQAMEIESKARTEAAEKTKLIRSLEMRLKHMHKLDSTQIIRIEQLERANKKQLHQIQELMLENERLVEQVARLEASAHVPHPKNERMHDAEMFVSELDL